MPIGGDNIGGLGQEGVVTDYYCTQTDLENRIGVKQLGQLTNDNAGDSAYEPVVTALRLKAYNTINAKLAGAYTVPFDVGSSTPGIINEISTDLACYEAMTRRFASSEVAKQWVEINKEAMALLDKIASGEMTIPSVTPSSDFGVITTATDNPQANFYSRGEISEWSDF